MLKEFKAFVMRGNLIEIAVGLVLALAFAALVSAFVDGIIMPIVAAIIGEPSFDGLTFTINDSVFSYGAVITQLVVFVSTAAALFYFVVKPVGALMARRAAGEEPETPAPPPEDITLLREIRDALRR